MINIAICDDEELFLQKEQDIILKYMEKNGYQYSIDQYLSGKQFLESNKVDKYDIVFLDVSMEEIDGMETARRIREFSSTVFLIFVSAFIVYSMEGYKVNASRYILKDDKTLDTAIEESLNAIIQNICALKKKHTFSFQEGRKEIDLSDIVYIESNLHKLIFHMNKSKKMQYSMYEKLDVIDTAIGQAGFCRIHKSYLVNMKYAEDIERYKMILTDGTNLSIAKTRYPAVKETFTMHVGVYDD